MALTGVHFILIFLGLDLIETKNLLVETENGAGSDYGWGMAKEDKTKVFEAYDLDGSGAVSRTEAIRVITGLKPEEMKKRNVVKKIVHLSTLLKPRWNKNQDSVLEFDEFVSNPIGKAKFSQDVIDGLKKVFDSWDQDESGTVSFKEGAGAILGLKPKEMEKVYVKLIRLLITFETNDKNKNGVLEYDEYMEDWFEDQIEV